MKYLKKPRQADKHNIRISVKDSNGVVSETMVEDVSQETVDYVLATLEPYPNSFTSKTDTDDSEVVD